MRINLLKKRSGSFLAFMKAEIETASIKESTKQDHRALYNKLKKYRGTLQFSDLNYAFICEFEAAMKAQGIHTNTVNKYFRTFKKYIRLAIVKDLIKHEQNPFLKYRSRSVKTKKVFMNAEELRKLEDLEVKKGTKAEKIRDMFLFASYCGLRFSDVIRLTNNHIKEGSAGLYAEITMQKTSVKDESELYLPLSRLHNGKAIQILDKYKDNSTEPIFSGISNAYANIVLKQLAKRAGIQKNVTFHVSRRTCATYLLNKGMSLKAVQHILGHSNISTTELYAKMNRTTIVRELESVDFD